MVMVHNGVAEGGKRFKSHYMAVHSFVPHDINNILVVAFYADKAVAKSCLGEADWLVDGTMGLYLVR